MEQKKLVEQLIKVSNAIYKNREPSGNYIHLIEEFIQKQADEQEISLDDMVEIIKCGSLPSEIYVTYDKNDGEIFCSFVDKEKCKREAEESGCGMQTVRLVSTKT